MRAEFVVPFLFSLFSVILAGQISMTDYDGARCNQGTTGTSFRTTDQCLSEERLTTGTKSVIYSCNSSILTVKYYKLAQCAGSISVYYQPLNVCLNETDTSSIMLHTCSSETSKVNASPPQAHISIAVALFSVGVVVMSVCL
jgi:hypothetical protein